MVHVKKKILKNKEIKYLVEWLVQSEYIICPPISSPSSYLSK